MIKRRIILLFVLVFITGILIGNSLKEVVLTGNVVSEEENYSWTTAICNSDKECIDVLISCSEGKVVSIEPVSELVSDSDFWGNYNSTKSLC